MRCILYFIFYKSDYYLSLIFIYTLTMSKGIEVLDVLNALDSTHGCAHYYLDIDYDERYENKYVKASDTFAFLNLRSRRDRNNPCNTVKYLYIDNNKIHACLHFYGDPPLCGELAHSLIFKDHETAKKYATKWAKNPKLTVYNPTKI